VESASVATALAKYDLPVPGGPYNKNALQGRLLPEIDHANHIKHLKQIAFNKLTHLKIYLQAIYHLMSMDWDEQQRMEKA
jgi:hypothetical protein